MVLLRASFAARATMLALVAMVAANDSALQAAAWQPVAAAAAPAYKLDVYTTTTKFETFESSPQLGAQSCRHA